MRTDKFVSKEVMRRSVILFDIIEGAVSVPVLTISLALIFDKEDPERSCGFGLFIFTMCVLFLLIPNLIFKFICKFRMRDTLLCQFLPLLSGGALYALYQLIPK